MSFTAQDQSIYNLFNRNCYHIPRNQRRYVWLKRNWQELLEDVMLVQNGIEKTHFIGSMVLYREKDRENGISYYTIIDGQQRIITLTIFLSSIAFWLKCYSGESEFNGTKQYIMARDDLDKDHVMVTSEYHMSLERYLCNIVLMSLEELKQMNIESFVKANMVSKKDRNIAAAFTFYLNKVNELVKESEKDAINFLVGLRDTIVNKMLYVSIIATSEEDACTVFEILNARGSVLEDHELLKNFIMRGIKPEGNIDQAKTIWTEIESDLGSNIGRFVKHYATHRYRSGMKDALSDYKTIQIANKGLPTQELLYDIRKKSTYYCQLIDPVCEGENANCSKTEYMVYSFFKKRRQEQIRPVLLSLIHQKENNNLSLEKYEEVILFLYDFFICYNIIGQENSNKITNIIYQMAYELENNYSDNNLQKLVTELSSKLPNKESFKNAFGLVGWSHHGGFYGDDKDKERVQIILEVLERHKSVGNRCGDFTIEHILDDADDQSNGKIGNLIPLEEQLNKRCSGKTFDEKLTIYKESSFQMARNFSERYVNKSQQGFDIEKRTNAMAEEFYGQVLKFKINIHTGCTESPRYKLISRKISKKEVQTIKEIVSNNSMGENKLPKYEQLSIFDIMK